MSERSEVDGPGWNLHELFVSALRLFAVAAIGLRITSVHGAEVTLDLVEDGGRKPTAGNHHVDEAAMLDEMAHAAHGP
jgi:hypothetical protein